MNEIKAKWFDGMAWSSSFKRGYIFIKIYLWRKEPVKLISNNIRWTPLENVNFHEEDKFEPG